MHVLLVHQAFAALDEPGGTRHHELARYIAARGHRVTIIASPVSYLTGTQAHTPASQAAGEDGVTILRASAYPALHRSFIHRVLSFLSFMFSSFRLGLKVRQVDLVWGTSPPIFQGFTAWALARVKHVPYLFEVRDLWPSFAIAMGVLKNPLLIWASNWLERFLYRHANLVIVNSPGFCEHVKSRGARRVELVPNGVDIHMFQPGDRGAHYRQTHGLEGKFVALYAGAHGMANDLGIVLEAASLLRDHPDIAFVLLGDGKDKPHLQALSEKLRLSNVQFLPPIPKNEIPQALAAADACIAILKPIELYKTVYPNKVFDYMASGRPVVLAIDGVIRQVVESAQAGIAVPPGDPQALAQAIRSLAENPHQGREMGESGRQYVETHFDRAALAELLVGLMEGMPAPSTSGAGS